MGKATMSQEWIEEKIQNSGAYNPNLIGGFDLDRANSEVRLGFGQNYGDILWYQIQPDAVDFNQPIP